MYLASKVNIKKPNNRRKVATVERKILNGNIG